MTQKEPDRSTRYNLPVKDFLTTRESDLWPYANASILARAVEHKGTENLMGFLATKRLIFADKLANPNWTVPNTYGFYKEIVDLALDDSIRIRGKGAYFYVYSSQGYTAGVVEALNLKQKRINEHSLARLLRALRGMGVYVAKNQPNLPLNSTLYQSVNRFIDANQMLPPKARDDKLLDIRAQWNRKKGTVAGFYEIMRKYTGNGTKNAGAARFLPYEMEYFKELVAHLRETDKPSELILKIMQGVVQKKTLIAISAQLRKETNVPMDESAIGDLVYLLSRDFTSPANQE